MVDIAAIQGAVTGLKEAVNVAKALKELSTSAEISGKISELYNKVLAAQADAATAQTEQLTLIQRIRDLEEEIACIKAWEETKKRYSLIKPWDWAFTYALKKQSDTTEPPH